jgi:cobalt/nickel transport system permease protein
MGVGAAFVFAAQMINFAIPGTGSSGHLGGGLLLAAMLGPHAAFIAMASILAVQALFFADGGLLALGCNAVNLGLFPCYVAYPLLFRPIAGAVPSRARLTAAAVVAAIVGLQLGSLGVVVETRLSGIAALPADGFLLLMQPIHLAIGAVEGLATAAVLLFVWRARPEALRTRSCAAGGPSRGAIAAGLLVAAVALSAAACWIASTRPDGLEWALARITGEAAPTAEPPTPGASLAGVVGAGLTLLVAGLFAFAVRRRLAARD